MTGVRMKDTADTADTAENWRQRAQQTRADAERESDPEIKAAMLEIATNYEQLAELAEKLDGSPTPK